MMNKNQNHSDSNLLKRLLGYAKPYWYLFLIALILLILLTILELVDPLLLKFVIDDHITIDQRIIYEVDSNNIYNTIKVNDAKYYSPNSIDKLFNKDLDKQDKKKIQKYNGDYYITDLDEINPSNGYKLSSQEFSLFREKDMNGISQISIIFFIVILLTFILTYIQTYLLNYTGQKIIFNIRNQVFNHIQNMSLNFFDNNAIGRLVTRVNNDTETLNEMYTSVLVNLFQDLFTLVGIIIIMLKMDFKLALYSFAFIPAFIIIAIIFRSKIRVAYRDYRKQLATVNSSLNENITGMRTIQIFNKQKKISEEFDHINSEFLDIAKREVQIHALLRPAIELIRSLAISILIYVGGNQVINSTMEFGTLYVFIDYLQRFFRPIFELTEKYNILQSSMASSERIFDILDNDNIIKNPENGIILTDIKGEIEFKNVWFAYEDDNWILKDLSFKIKPGQSVAIVGPTGAGKTSIINLITRFYEIQKGEILLDGINIKDIDKFSLRDNIGVVLQDVFMFSGTIEDNIKLNKKDITRKEVIEVSKYVNAHQFIKKLPLGYDEPVMERGSTLSTGEKQLLSFARTLASNPKILILDEATANIDTETEILIQDALSKLIKDRTSIAIAHRLSTIQHADNIIVIDQGEIVEQGNHQELLDKNGVYKNLYELQYKDQVK